MEPLPWSYRREANRLTAGAEAMLDMGTGGGEVLRRLARPPFTVANEAWPPNVPVAGRRLHPLGVAVVQDEGATDNVGQEGDRGRLPFRTGAFPLVVNRHESFRASEVARVLVAGGSFLTQQVDGDTYRDFYPALGLDPPDEEGSWLPVAVEQVSAAGLEVVAARTGEERQRFHDVGAVVYYLRAVGWAILGLDVEACMPALRRLHERMQQEPLVVHQRRFLLEARKPED